jgi:hypothetical protein
MVLYRTSPRTSSQLVVRTMVDSFYRIEDITGRIALLAAVAGLLSVEAAAATDRRTAARVGAVVGGLGPAALIFGLWAYMAWRQNGLVHMRRFLADGQSAG